METIGYLAIQEFKKLQPEEQKDLALKFVTRAWRPKREYRFGLAREFKLDTTDQDLTGLVKLLKGENPVTFGSQYAIKNIKLSGQWQDALEQFNAYLFKEKPGFKALKKGYDKALNIPTIEHYRVVISKLADDERVMSGFLRITLPAMERSIIAIPNSVTSKGGAKRRGPNYLKKRALERFGQLYGTLQHRIKLINKIEDSLKFLTALLRQDPTINKVKKGEAATLATALAPKDTFNTDFLPKTSDNEFFKSQFPIKSFVPPKEIQGIRKQIFAWQRTYNKSMIDYMNSLLDMDKQFNWFKRNLKGFADVGAEVNADSVKELRNAQNSFNKIKEEVEYALPFVGAAKMFDPLDYGSDESKAAMAIFAMDSALLVAAMATAASTAGVSLIVALSAFALYETAQAVGIGHVFPYIIKKLKYVFPNKFGRDTPY